MAETVAMQVLADRVLLAGAAAGPDGVRVTELVSHQVEADQDAHEVAAQLARDRRIENIGLGLLVDWRQYSVRDAWIPFTAMGQIRSTIKFELEDDLDIPADELLLPFDVVETRPDASHVIAWAARKAAVGEALQQWDRMGLSPEYMPPDAVGHVGLVHWLAADLAEQPVVAVSGDADGVDITLLQGRTLWARRRFLGFSWATDAAGQPLQEIRRMFLSVPGFPEPAAVVSFGAEAADTLARVISDDLRCPVRTVQRPENIPGAEDMMAWPLVAGVAAMMAGGGQRPLSFRVEEFEPKETAHVVSLLSVVATALLGVVLLVGGAWLQLSAAKVRADSAALRSRLTEYWKVAGIEAKPPRLVLLESDLSRRIEDARRQIEKAKEHPNAIKRFRELGEVLAGVPQDISVEFDRIDIAKDNITIMGKTNSYDAATQLNGHMNSNSKRLSATLENIDTQPDGAARFSMKIAYTEAP